MKKLIVFGLFSIFYLFPKNAHAALIEVNNTGTITVNVLSATSDGFKIKKLASANYAPDNSKITLAQNNGKLELKVDSASGTKSLDVTGLDQDLIEIEKYIAPQTIKIQASDNDFSIIQGSATAKTIYPIEVNTQDKQILIKSPSGYEYLKTLPLDAINSLRILGVQSDINSLIITQNQKGDLVYLSSGEKVLNILGIYDLKIPVTANVSVSSGKISNINGPIWYKLFGFLLV
jgi:hypothetical protein